MLWSATRDDGRTTTGAFTRFLGEVLYDSQMGATALALLLLRVPPSHIIPSPRSTTPTRRSR
jgi:hypothetical protein